MSEKKRLISDISMDAYIERFKNMQKYKYTEKGDEMFIEKIVATSEQVDNLYVKAKVNDFLIFNDEPPELGGSSKASRPMEMLLASIANCIELSALLYFSFAKLSVKSIKVVVEAEFDKRSVLSDKDAPLPGFYNLKCTWFVDTDEDLEKIEKVLKKVDANCPVIGTMINFKELSYNIILKEE